MVLAIPRGAGDFRPGERDSKRAYLHRSQLGSMSTKFIKCMGINYIWSSSLKEASHVRVIRGV